VGPASKKWKGASMWVPECTTVENRLTFKLRRLYIISSD